MLRKLPKVIRLKGRVRDWIIKIDLVSKETMVELSGKKSHKGYWDDEQIRIVIRNDLDIDMQWWALWHELNHAVLDLWYMDEDSPLDEEDG